MQGCWLIRGKQGNCKSGNYFVFWARDFLTTWRNPKMKFYDLGPSYIPTGKITKWETLCNFFLWHVSSFYSLSSIAKMQCPFNNNIAFIDWVILWASAVDIDWLYVTANLLMKVRTCWNKMTVASVTCRPVLEDLFRQADWIFHVRVARLRLVNFLSFTWLSRRQQSSSPLLCGQRGALWRPQSLHQWFFPVSSYCTRSKAI